MTASQQPTEHDKAVALAEALHRHTCPWQGEWDDCRCPEPDPTTLAALRAALAAGDTNVAEALGIHPCGHIAIQRDCGGCDPGAVEFVRDDGGEWRTA